jgi:hypothetical protein
MTHLSKYRDEAGKLVSIMFPQAVGYLDGDGCTLCADCANKDDQDRELLAPNDCMYIRSAFFTSEEERYNVEQGELPETCDGCSRAIDPALRPQEDACLDCGHPPDAHDEQDGCQVGDCHC